LDGTIFAECKQLDQQAVTAAIRQCGRHLPAVCKQVEVKISNKCSVKVGTLNLLCLKHMLGSNH